MLDQPVMVFLVVVFLFAWFFPNLFWVLLVVLGTAGLFLYLND